MKKDWGTTYLNNITKMAKMQQYMLKNTNKRMVFHETLQQIQDVRRTAPMHTLESTKEACRQSPDLWYTEIRFK